MGQSWRWLSVAALLAAGVPILAVGQDEPPRPQNRGRQTPLELLQRLDTNNDGYLDESEIPERMKQRFAQMDRDGDGKLSRQELAQAAGRGGQPPAQRPAAGNPLLRLLDADGDGELSNTEIERAPQALRGLDKNADGKVDQRELASAFQPAGRGGRPGEIITPPTRGERHMDSLHAGDVAPDFTLPLLYGKGEVTLSSFHGKRPVVLIFASYT